jgi:arginase family enzyme
VRAALLHLDEALMAQHRLRQAVVAAGGRVLDYRDLGPELRLWSRPRQVDRLRRRLAAALPPGFGPMLVISGSGDFHHITQLLLERALAAAAQPVTLIHFDNHPDWVRFQPGVHCGSWVGGAARLPNVAKVITVGVCSDDVSAPNPRLADLDLVEAGRLEIYPYRAPKSAPSLRVCGQEWPAIEALGEAAFADLLPTRIATEAVYITIDKDVLRAEDAGTNWDQGQTSVAFLKSLIGRACEGRRLIGADIVGDWSKAVYGGTLLAPFLKQGEALLDQPWRAPGLTLLEGNETVNLELLDLFQEVAR